jgi:hypothetical protein
LNHITKAAARIISMATDLAHGPRKVSIKVSAGVSNSEIVDANAVSTKVITPKKERLVQVTVRIFSFLKLLFK